MPILVSKIDSPIIDNEFLAARCWVLSENYALLKERCESPAAQNHCMFWKILAALFGEG